MKKYLFYISVISLSLSSIQAQNKSNINDNKFKQLKEELATPNAYRNAAGAPGYKYYQNRADYSMNITLNDQEQSISGEETITYHNESPDVLEYIWVQLDQNMRAKNSDTYKVSTNTIKGTNFGAIQRQMNQQEFDGGFKISKVLDKNGKDLTYTINKTMMRVELPAPIKPNSSFSFSINWSYNINNRMEIGGRSGYEFFEDEDNYIYTIAQFYPRMAVYNDVEGWQNKQFLGNGEFTLPFGNYDVKLNVPSDHVVAATGTLQNPDDILSEEQKERWKEAKKSDVHPVMIVTEKEAIKKEKKKEKALKTWHFKAENVRDFGWASSRKFIWDAMVVHQETKDVMAMSYYPKEGNPLWEQYSTKAVAHTLRSYSSHTFDYPYPVAISVHTKWIGMEYPMICFNGGRPEADGTYSKMTKYSMISVIIHEVGHNYFPMIVNSDERQWTWMDEGLNTFLQYLAEQEWERGYPSHRGPAFKIVNYMKGNPENISPIMTNSESILQFGNNAYGKPATALNILRETVMGRELFDYAFKTYARRWMFKHPTPADFFRTMEDASAVDLDWFWRGWFFTTDHVDISLENVSWYQINTKDPRVEYPINAKKETEKAAKDVSNQKNKIDIEETYLEKDPTLEDFYNSYNPFNVTSEDSDEYKEFFENLSDEQKEIMKRGGNYYQLDFSNKGGLVMPLIIEFTFKDGKTETVRIPAEIWKNNNWNVSKVFWFEKEVVQVQLDPNVETADTDVENNSFPRKMQPSRFEMFESRYSRYGSGGSNPMKKSKKKK